MTSAVHSRPDELFGVRKPIIGMLHLAGSDRDAKVRIAVTEASQMVEAGVDGLIVEDYFADAVVVEDVLATLVRELPEAVCGVNILKDWRASFELAERYGARFVQVDSVAGHLPPTADEAFAADLRSVRAKTGVAVFGGVRFKYQPYESGRTLEEDLHLGRERGDVLIVTGTATGVPTDIAKIRTFRSLLGSDYPLFVGAGMHAGNAAEQLAIADGAIVGSYFKQEHRDTGAVVPGHVREFMDVVREVRASHGGNGK